MSEESHLDEMRQAIRGDFERLAERRGEQGLLRAAEPEATPDEAPPEAEPGHGDDPERERRSWFARLLSP